MPSPELLADPQESISNRIHTDWLVGNTPALGAGKPTVTTGWYTIGSKKPQVSVTDRTEIQTVEGLNSGGTGYNQYVQEQVFLDLWTISKQQRSEAIGELKRIVMTFALGFDDVRTLVLSGMRGFVETGKPTLYRANGALTYWIELTI